MSDAISEEEKPLLGDHNGSKLLAQFEVFPKIDEKECPEIELDAGNKIYQVNIYKLIVVCA